MLTCSGEVDSATAAQLPSAILDGLPDPNGGPIVIDITAVRVPSSAGHGAPWSTPTVTRPGTVSRCGSSSTTPARCCAPIQLIGLDKVLTLYHFVDNAVRGDTAAEGHSGDAGNTDSTWRHPVSASSGPLRGAGPVDRVSVRVALSTAAA